MQEHMHESPQMIGPGGSGPYALNRFSLWRGWQIFSDQNAQECFFMPWWNDWKPYVGVRTSMCPPHLSRCQ